MEITAATHTATKNVKAFVCFFLKSVKQNAIHIWLHASYGRCHTGWQDLLKCSAHEYFRLTIRQCARTAAYSEPTSSESLEKQSVWKVGEKKKQTTPNAVTLKEKGKYEDGQK